MRANNGTVWMAGQPLEQLGGKSPLQTLAGKSLPVATSYQLAKLANKLIAQLQVISNVRNGLILKYGEPSEDGRSTTVRQDSERYAQFVEEHNELMAIEVEIMAAKVKLPVSLEIEPSVLMALEPFVEV